MVNVRQEDGQIDREKVAQASVCDVRGTISPSCKATQAIRDFHDESELLRSRSAIVGPICACQHQDLSAAPNSRHLASVT